MGPKNSPEPKVNSWERKSENQKVFWEHESLEPNISAKNEVEGPQKISRGRKLIAGSELNPLGPNVWTLTPVLGAQIAETPQY